MTTLNSRRGEVVIGHTRVPLRAYFVGVLVLLFVPIALLFVFSISQNRALTFPIEGLTLDWYRNIPQIEGLLGAARNSLVVATSAATIATALGTAVTIALLRFQFVGRRALAAVGVLPLVVPYVVLAAALLLLFRGLDLPLSLFTVGAAHVVVAMPFAILIMVARMIGMDPALEDAAMDLGATYPGTLRLVVLPLMGPALLSAWITCFVVSFDEVALANFLVGTGEPTFPVFLFGQLRYPLQLPSMIAMAVLLMVCTLTLTVVAERVRRRNP